MAHDKPIVIVGSISMDVVSCAPHIPAVGETVIGTSFSTTPGGKGANQAVAAARLGHPVQMVGKVGEDAYGDPLLDGLSHSGVDVRSMGRFPGSSGLAHIFVAQNGENSIIIIPGANADVSPAFIDEHADVIRSAGLVLCQLELPLATTLHTIDLCTAAAVPLILDPAPAAPLPDSVFPHITWFTPNETEAALYDGGAQTPEELARQLLARGVGGVALKRGAEGAYIANAEKAAWVPGFKVEAVDTVAAGDCFNGAFAVGLMHGMDPWEAGRFANAAAAISVTRRGAQASMPTREEVDAFVLKRS